MDLKEIRWLLRQQKVDLVHILLPHFLHGRYAKAAMESGVNVLTEKPITISLSEADELIGSKNKQARSWESSFRTAI